MVNYRLFIYLGLAILTLPAWGDPPSEPEARKIYDHNYQWLSKQHSAFIAANMRGANDEQYRERRMAALDLIRTKRDLTTVPELLDELQRKSFLSGDICDILGEWKTKKAIPYLQEVAADSKRPPEVRQKAEKALSAIKSAPAAAEAPSAPAY
jgi:hypothetical protein